MKKLRLRTARGFVKKFLVWFAAFATLISLAPAAAYADAEDTVIEQVSHESKDSVTPQLIKPGEKKTAKADSGYVVYYYKPTKDGEYAFYSSDRSKGAPVVEMYDDSKLENCVDVDYDWDDDGIFEIKTDLDGETTYYFKVYSSDKGAFSCYVHLRKVSYVNVTFNTGKETEEAWFYQGGQKVSYATREEETGVPLEDLPEPSCIENLLFVGWSADPAATEPDEKIIVSSTSKTLYAVWKKYASLKEDAAVTLEEESGSTYYAFTPKTLTNARYEVALQLQGSEGAGEIRMTLYDVSMNQVTSCSEQGSALTWLLPGLRTGSIYYLSFKSRDPAVNLNGTFLLQRAGVASATFNANHRDAYYTTVDEDTGEVEKEPSLSDTLKIGTVIHSSASGTSINIPDHKESIRFLGWSTVKGATAPDEEIIVTSTTNSVYAVWEENANAPGSVIRKEPSQITLQGKTVTYNGKPVSSNAAAVKGSSGIVTYAYFSDKACTNAITAPKNAGTWYVRATVAADADYEAASAVAAIVIKPVTPKLTKRVGKAKATKVKKKEQTVKGTIRISSPSGKAAYVRVKKGSDKCLTINKKTGTITVKRSTKKGIYRIKVRVSIPKTRNSTALTKTVTVKVKVG